MTDPDPRVLPLVELEIDQIRALLSPLLNGAAIAGVERMEGGLVNTLYRVTPADGDASLCLRIFAGGRLPWETERKALTRVSASLPVPDVLLADSGNSDFSYPYLVYRWIEGIMLNKFRRRETPATLLSVAETLGRLLAGVASFSFADGPNVEPNGVHSRLSSIEALLSVNEKMLLSGLARKRLGSALADGMWRLFEANADLLCKLDGGARLGHGDFGGRNILGAPSESGGWRVS